MKRRYEVKVTAANEQDWAQVKDLAQAAADAPERGNKLEVVKHTEAKRGFVLQPRRWVVERSLAWAARFHVVRLPLGSP